ncbi:MAG: lysophospholipid acyltransferase family protein [Polyangiaceae bacterium]
MRGVPSYGVPSSSVPSAGSLLRHPLLARLTDFAAQDVIPRAQRAYGAAMEGVEDATVRVLGDDFDARIEQLRARYQRMGGDPFGLDPETAKLALGIVSIFHRVYFRAEVHGVDNVPSGKVLLVANHSGQVPIDGMIIGASMFLDGEPPRVIRAMVEKWVQTLPYVNVLFRSLGQVVGVPENCRRLLELGEVILVFPEGTRGISKPFSQRYQLQDFGLGFMRLAIETDTPIVPVAVVGAEEQYVNLGNFKLLARAMGMPVAPVVPQWFIPGLQMPLPTKYRLYFGEPMRFSGDPDDDDSVMEEKVYLVRQTIQALIDRGLRERPSVFW